MSSARKVIILTEGSREIGFGHLARCLALSRAFKKKGAGVSLVVAADRAAREFLSGQADFCFSWREQKPKLWRLLSGVEIAVVDSYLADFSTYQEIAARVQLLVCLDDNKRLDYPAGLIVNAAPSAEEFKYPSGGDQRFLLGPDYALLRPEFWRVGQARPAVQLTKFFLTFGSEDLRNLTPKVLAYLVKTYPKAQKLVVCGQGFRNVAEVKKVADSKTKLFYNPTARQMKRLMSLADVAVCAGGQTLFELSRVGLPAVAITVASNQLRHVSSWRKTGFIEAAGRWDAAGLMSRVAQALGRLESSDKRRQRAALGQWLVDGQGALRVAGVALERLKNTPALAQVRLRRASSSDCRALFRLVNDHEVRANSFQTQLIEWSDHRKWFSEQLRDPTTFFLVAKVEGKFAGQVRFVITNETALVGISLEAKYRRQHLATLLLPQAISLCRRAHPHLKQILAQVKIGNKPSQRLFERLGFSRSRHLTVQHQKAVEYVFDPKAKRERIYNR